MPDQKPSSEQEVKQPPSDDQTKEPSEVESLKEELAEMKKEKT